MKNLWNTPFTALVDGVLLEQATRVPPKKKRIIYAQGRPYGAPLVMVRGGGTRDPEVKEFLRNVGFRWDDLRFAWATYLDKSDFRDVLLKLQEMGLEVVPKKDLDPKYAIDLDQ